MAVEQLLVERALAVDERRLRAGRLRDLDEALCVRARLRADHEHERRALRDHRLHRVLAVLRRVTDVVGVRPPQRAEVILERVDDRRDVVEGQRRLRDHRDGLVACRAPAPARATRSRSSSRAAPERPDHLDVVLVADERDEMAAVGVAPRLGVDLVHERARRVDDPQAAPLRVLLDRRRDAVRGEDADRAGRDLVLRLDEDRAELLEARAGRGRCGRSRGGRRPARRAARAAARRSRSRGRRRRRTSAARRGGRGRVTSPAPAATASSSACNAFSASCIERIASPRRVATQRSEAGDVRAAVGVHRPVDALDGAARVVGDRADDTGEPAAARERRRSPCPPRRRRSPRAGGRARPRRGRGRRRRARRRRGRRGRRARAPSHSVAPVSSTTRVASSTSPTPRSPSEPARPNETRLPSGTPFATHTPTRTAFSPSRLATRSSAVVATANVSPSASTRGSARSPSSSSRPRTPPTARTRSGSPQCSQRGSLPGPYASHSMPSSSASYVGKIPSVSR